TFLAVPESELARFCEVYGRYSTPFWMNTRPETVTEKSVKALVAVGLDRVSVGVECGNEDYRRRHLNRHHSNAVIEQAFDILHAQGIATTANIMIGLPDETPELIRESMALVRKIKPTSVGLAVFQPYKGTRLYQYALEKGYVDAAKWVRSTCYTPNMKNPFLTDNELMDALYSFSETTGKS
ncbi:MAG: radical SAM protein, partial [Desulfobacteraceae bacterium]